jgi:uncharacterized protein YigE (DUF2233 family)
MNPKFLITGFFFLFHMQTISAQFTEKKNLNFNNALYDVFIIRADSGSLKKITTSINKTGLSEMDFFDQLSTSLQQPYFAITASIVDTNCHPLGLFISDGNRISNINMGVGTGNFYLKPNGLLYIDSLHQFAIQETSAFNPALKYRVAIQSGPMLLLKGVVNSAFDRNSKNRNTRCGVGVFVDKKEQYLVFAKSITPVTFYQFANLFAEKFNCSDALNLESSNNCSLHFPTINTAYRSLISICSYLVIPL